MPSIVWTIVSYLLIFSVVCVSHEFGHFLFGRLNGIKVNEFTIGLGPVIFKKQGKNTLFTIRLFPFGGACIYEGMFPEDEESDSADDNDAKDSGYIPAPGTFQAANVWGRIATVFAGPFFNIILAFLLSVILCWFCGSDLPIISDTMEGYPAEEAGLAEGDRIVEIDGQNIYLWREVSVTSMMNQGEPLSIVYERDGNEYETVITPKYDAENDRYYIGFTGGTEHVICNDISVFKYSWYEVRYWLITTYKSLGYLLSGNGSKDDLAGPVGVATVIDETIEETSQYGIFTVILNMINITILLSVNLGVLNLLPIPALDGGRLLLLLIEAVTGKRIPPEKEGIIQLIGFVLLAGLTVFVLFNDISRIFRGGF